MLLDTHCHLNDEAFKDDLEAVLERAREADVRAFVCVGYNVPSSYEAVKLADRFGDVWAAVGVHPHDARTVDESALAELSALAQHPKVVAIGEIGLDFYRDLSPRPVQKDAFGRQLQLAVEKELPVIIHDREACADALDILGKFTGPLRGVAHCFSGTLEQARAYRSLGFWLGLDGPLTYKRNNQLRTIAGTIGLEGLVLETDAPYLAPQAKRGRRNESAYLVWIAERLAEVCSVSMDEVAKVTTHNAQRLFKLPGFDRVAR